MALAFVCSALILILAIITFVAGLFAILEYFDNRRGYPKIDFKSFKKFYVLNPQRWTCHSGYVICYTGQGFGYDNFSFGFIDYYKYRCWMKAQDRQNTENIHNASKRRMMDAVKIDIANSEAEAKKAQAKLMEELRKQCNESEDTLFDLMKLVEEYKGKIL